MPNVIKSTFTFDSDLFDYFDSIEYVPRDVQARMLTAMSDVIVEGQKKTATEMLTVDSGYGARGRFTDRVNGIIGNVKQGRIKKISGDPYGYKTDVIFGRTQHGERVAAIAFMNEYGVVHKPNKKFRRAYVQPPRPFISKANLTYGERAVNAASAIFEEFIDKNK